MLHDELRRALEAIKLRAPIEDVVRERVPGLRKAGRLWIACCPFHDERTPSFKVDPQRGTWRCYGACATGGDVIGFVERSDNLPFLEAVEVLAARTGVELPQRSARKQSGDADAALYAALDRAQRHFQAALATEAGAAAARYLERRGIALASASEFGLGWSSPNGQTLVADLRTAGIPLEVAEQAGLVRRDESGRAYSFFRGRLMIPIRDAQGRTVGFGARRLDEHEESGPKYVNTPETSLFHKGRLVYAFDRAAAAIRRSAHAVLVEGYTDVIAAHQVGVQNVVAVLGTATTEDHAAMLRRTGLRRISLVFDGDEAGRNAAWRALSGLLHLSVDLDVVSLEGGIDPCDVCVQDGASGFLGRIEQARAWFDFACASLDGLRGAELARAADRVLELVARVPKPVHREDLIVELARRMRMPAEALREQYHGLASVRAKSRGERAGVAPRTADATGTQSTLVAPAAAGAGSAQREIVLAYEEITGALLADPALFPAAAPWISRCPDPELARILAAIAALRETELSVPSGTVLGALDEGAVLTWLADDPARARVLPLVERARAAAEDDWPPQRILEEQIARLVSAVSLAERRRLGAQLRAIETRQMESGGVQAALSDPEALDMARRLVAGEAGS